MIQSLMIDSADSIGSKIKRIPSYTRRFSRKRDTVLSKKLGYASGFSPLPETTDIETLVHTHSPSDFRPRI